MPEMMLRALRALEPLEACVQRGLRVGGRQNLNNAATPSVGALPLRQLQPRLHEQCVALPAAAGRRWGIAASGAGSGRVRQWGLRRGAGWEAGARTSVRLSDGSCVW